jgi:hypothetical protein
MPIFLSSSLKTVSHEEYEDPSNSNENGNISFDTVVLLYRRAVERCLQRFLEVCCQLFQTEQNDLFRCF